MKLSKKKSTERIDGLVCIVMGLGRALANPEPAAPALYFFGAGG